MLAFWWNRISNAKQQSQNSNGTHRRKVSFSGFLGEEAYAKQVNHPTFQSLFSIFFSLIAAKFQQNQMLPAYFEIEKFCTSAGNGNGNQLKQHVVGAEIIEQRPPPLASAVADSGSVPISPQPRREDGGASECAEEHKKLPSASRLPNRSCESPQGEQLQPLPPLDLSHRFQRPRSREDLEAFRIRR